MFGNRYQGRLLLDGTSDDVNVVDWDHTPMAEQVRNKPPPTTTTTTTHPNHPLPLYAAKMWRKNLNSSACSPGTGPLST